MAVRSIFAIIAVAVSVVVSAAEAFPLPPRTTAVVTNAAAVMEAKVFNGADGGALRYRMLSPATVEVGRKYPLVLFFHGALWQCNGNVRYREYPGEGHGCWIPTYNDNQVLDWFFSQAKDNGR